MNNDYVYTLPITTNTTTNSNTTTNTRVSKLKFAYKLYTMEVTPEILGVGTVVEASSTTTINNNEPSSDVSSPPIAVVSAKNMSFIPYTAGITNIVQ